LINFARSFIYTTALPPHTLATIIAAYQFLDSTLDGSVSDNNLKLLNSNIAILRLYTENKGLNEFFTESNSAIHSCIIPGNDSVKRIAGELINQGFDVRPILSPTVPEGEERLRFCLHSFNTKFEIEKMLSILFELIHKSD
jgi:8-amino-7-oxononanoate synthase